MKQFFLALAATTLVFSSCKKDDTSSNNGDGYKGYVYTCNNATSGNGVIAMGRKSDGTLTELSGSPYATGSAGDAAEGDFDEQWSLRIVGDYLVVVNAGANPVNGTISVFKINRADGSLKQVDQNPATTAMDNMDSHGERPTSIAAKNIGGTMWIAVGNQFANPNYQKPTEEQHGTIMNSPNRNVAVFSIDATTGLLSFRNIGATYMDGTNGGPCTVDFNEDGSRIAISTWGVTHFATPEPNLALQKPGRLYIYSFSNGNMSLTGMYEETGVSGNIGFSWSPGGQYIYLTNFNLHSSKEDYSVTVHNSTTAALVQHFGTGARNDEACWTWVSLDKTKLFVASFTENIVSVFDIGSDGKLSVSLSPNHFMRSGVPEEDTKEMYQSPDGYLYVAGSFQSHTITTFRIGGGGALSENAGSPYHVPSSAGKSKLEHAYMGLTGFEK